MGDFDRVPRELLWQEMRKFGYPPKFMRILQMLHGKVKVHFSMHGVEKMVNSAIGVKQGDLLGPDLFNLHISAAVIIWRKRYNAAGPPKCTFRTRKDFVMGSGSNKNKRRWDLGARLGGATVGKAEVERGVRVSGL